MTETLLGQRGRLGPIDLLSPTPMDPMIMNLLAMGPIMNLMGPMCSKGLMGPFGSMDLLGPMGEWVERVSRIQLIRWVR